MNSSGDNGILPPIQNNKSQYASPGRRQNQSLSIDFRATQLRSVTKHIKNNDVNQLMGNSQIVIDARKDDADVMVDEKREISQNLTSLRKKYDETKEHCNKKEQEITRMRTEIEKMKNSESFIKEDSSKTNQRLQDLEDSLREQKQRIEEAILAKSTYEHMLDRMKKDKIADKLKNSHIELDLNHRMGELNEELEKARKAKQMQIQTQQVFEEVTKHVELEDKKRKESLNIFLQTLKQKSEAERKRDERIKRTQDIAENAAAEIRDSNEKKWRELLLVHKFLNFFLKRKMEREMKQYEAVEQAFQKIKASTGLNDAKEIVNKFINREQTYSELLISIADYERKIDELKKINDGLKSKIHSLKEKNVPGAGEKSKTEKNEASEEIPEIYKELGAKTDSYKQSKLVVEKTYSWAIKTLVKLDKAENISRHNYYEIYPKEKVTEAFLKVLERIKGHLATLKQTETDKILDEIDRTRIDEEIKREDFLQKNVRVKPTAPRMEKRTSESLSNSKGSISRDEIDFEESDNEETFNEEEADKFFNEMRDKVKEQEAKEREIARKKKLQEKKEKEGN